LQRSGLARGKIGRFDLTGYEGFIMNILSKSRKQSGVGLIEILIVLVVLVIGWAAIAALQGKLMSGSSVTKTRNIALELAREKTEEMRTAIEKGQYDFDLVAGSVADGDEEIISAIFSRSWTLSDLDINGASAENLKQLVMTVTWKGNDYDADKDNLEKVVLNTLIVFSDPLKSSFLEPDGTGRPGGFAPINAQTGREGPGTVTALPTEDDLAEEGDPDTDDDNIYTGEDEDGNLVVYQGTPIANADGILEFRDGLTVYGGKILKFSGTVYYASDHPFIQATSPSFCSAFYPTQSECGTDGLDQVKGRDIKCAEYACFAGGDCSNGGAECNHLTDTQIAALPDLDGGWFGKIGDFFPDITLGPFATICMGDPLHQTDESGISVGVPARLLVTKRVFAGSETGFSREGINKSFEGYDTFISAFNDPLCDLLFEALVPSILPSKPLPTDDPRQIVDYEIIRCLEADTTNVVLPSTGFTPGVAPNDVFTNVCQ
jgi:hypothetical protein